MISEKYVIKEDGRYGVIVSAKLDENDCHTVVVCKTGQEEKWHFKQIYWVWLTPSETLSKLTKKEI